MLSVLPRKTRCVRSNLSARAPQSLAFLGRTDPPHRPSQKDLPQPPPPPPPPSATILLPPHQPKLLPPAPPTAACSVCRPQNGLPGRSSGKALRPPIQLGRTSSSAPRGSCAPHVPTVARHVPANRAQPRASGPPPAWSDRHQQSWGLWKVRSVSPLLQPPPPAPGQQRLPQFPPPPPPPYQPCNIICSRASTITAASHGAMYSSSGSSKLADGPNPCKGGQLVRLGPAVRVGRRATKESSDLPPTWTR